MGFKVDWGTNSDDSSSVGKLAEGRYEAELLKFESGTSSQKGTPFVRPVFGNLVDAVDVDGNEWPNKWKVNTDRSELTFWLSPKAMWRLKKFASDFGVELPDEDAEFDSLEEFAEILGELFAGPCEVEVRHVASHNDPDVTYANVVNAEN